MTDRGERCNRWRFPWRDARGTRASIVGRRPAGETAAFTFQLLKYARHAKTDLRGVCLEYRGDVTV